MWGISQFVACRFRLFVFHSETSGQSRRCCSFYLVDVVEVGALVGPVVVALLHAVLHQRRQHDDHHAAVLPHHLQTHQPSVRVETNLRASEETRRQRHVLPPDDWGLTLMWLPISQRPLKRTLSHLQNDFLIYFSSIWKDLKQSCQHCGQSHPLVWLLTHNYFKSSSVCQTGRRVQCSEEQNNTITITCNAAI